MTFHQIVYRIWTLDDRNFSISLLMTARCLWLVYQSFEWRWCFIAAMFKVQQSYGSHLLFCILQESSENRKDAGFPCSWQIGWIYLTWCNIIYIIHTVLCLSLHSAFRCLLSLTLSTFFSVSETSLIDFLVLTGMGLLSKTIASPGTRNLKNWGNFLLVGEWHP